eukprot:m.625229 g.625229  ORF g.625229 m.625229 type:complete len:181 (+) comp22547_c0_seq8:301-843(+)
MTADADEALEDISRLKEHSREIGEHAVWTLSSCKQGFGVKQLRDGKVSTYWQSDGPQPHLINLQFPKKTEISAIALYADYRQDESYTPNKISIRIGTSYHDIQEICGKDLTEPQGWVCIPLSSNGNPIRTNMLQVAVISNHQNGRDTHLRMMEVFTPNTPLLPKHIPFTSQECVAVGCIR